MWRGYLKQAEKEIAQAIILDPSVLRYHTIRGDIIMLQSMFTKAESHYKTAMRLTSDWDDSHTPWVLYECATYLLELGRKDEAINYLEQILDMSPDYVSARCILALELMQKGEQDKAREQANLAMQTNPWSPPGHKNIARIHRKFGDLQQAIEHYSKAIEMGQGLAFSEYDAYLERALCYIQVAEQQLAHQDLVRARKSASILIRRCSNNFYAIYSLAFIHLAQGHTRKAIRTLRRAQTKCSPPGSISDLAEQTRLLGTIEPNLTGCTEFLDALEHPIKTRQRVIPGIRKLTEILRLTKAGQGLISDDGSLGSKAEQWDSQTDLRRIKDHVMRMQQDLQAKTIEVINQRLVVSLPHQEDSIEELPYEGSIEKVSYVVEEGYFNVIVLASGGLLFSEKDVIFTSRDRLPMLRRNRRKRIERAEDNKITKLVISIPYNEGSIKQVHYLIAGRYLHMVLHGSITSSFDESKVKFASYAEEVPHGEQQEEETATPEVSLIEPRCLASDSLPSIAAPIEPEQ